MLAWRPRARPPEGRSADDDLRLEIERLRAFVEMRAQAQENLMHAMLSESAARAAEALEGRIQLAVGEAMAFAEHGFERHEASLRAFGRRLAELSREAWAPTEPSPVALAEAGEFLIGAASADWPGCLRLPLRDESEAAFLADLAHLPILPGGAARLVVAHVVEFTPAEAFEARLLPHWRDCLAPGGELVILTLDGPAWAADIQRGECDFAALRERLGVDGASRPLQQLFDAAALIDALREAGLATDPPEPIAPFALKVVARPAPR